MPEALMASACDSSLAAQIYVEHAHGVAFVMVDLYRESFLLDDVRSQLLDCDRNIHIKWILLSRMVKWVLVCRMVEWVIIRRTIKWA